MGFVVWHCSRFGGRRATVDRPSNVSFECLGLVERRPPRGWDALGFRAFARAEDPVEITGILLTTCSALAVSGGHTLLSAVVAGVSLA